LLDFNLAPPGKGLHVVPAKQQRLVDVVVEAKPVIITTRGQTTCHGLMYRFISAIQ
jgi:hypothetical protein